MMPIRFPALLALLCCLAPLSSPAQELALTPMPQTTVPKWWQERSDLLNTRAKAGGFDVMFIGDSITQGWEGAGKKVWEEKIAPLKAANFGISGDRVEHVLWRMQNGNLDKNANPKVAVMMIGTNNTGHRREKPEMIAAGVKAIIGEIQSRKPDTKILVLAIFPRGAKPDDAQRKNNEAANALIQKYADGKKVFYLDINKTFLEPDGTLSKTTMPDLLHLTEGSYEKWADAVVPEIKKLL